MKFGKRLQEEIVPQWAEHYVDYKRLKEFVINTDLTGVEFSNALFKMVAEELTKAENLFEELLTELQTGYDEVVKMDPMQKVPSSQRRAMRFFRRQKRTTAATMDLEDGAAAVSIVGSEFDTDVYSEYQEQNGCLILLKRIFFFVIGDSQLSRVKAEPNSVRALYLEWYSNAAQLQHFAELNVEAIRKAVKKLKKYRRMEANYTYAMEAELGRSRLTTLMPRLHNLISHLNSDYERKFQDSLAPYADVSLNQAWTAKWRYVFLSIFMFFITLYAPVLEEHKPAHNCLALFVLVVVMWLTEAIPFFCTAMLIPLLAVPLGIILDPATEETATPTVASQIILGKVFNHVQILVMGGLTIGKACARTNLEMYAASALHKWTAHRPSLYLLGVMVGSCILCAFVSNVAAPLLVLGVVQRTLWEFPEGTTAPHGILLGLAFACNLGGMLSPIASPQNAVAMTALSFHDMSFSAWVAVALPVVMCCVVAAWAIILIVWRPFKDVPYIPLQVVNAEADKNVTRADRIIVLAVSFVTIVLWILPPSLIFGDTGIVALIPIVVFFGIGILSKDDFNTLSWHLMFLLAGGNMLGLCARDSHMLDIATVSMKDVLSTSPPYATLVAVVLLVGVITTFVSHTVAAMIMLPIIVKIGFLMPPSEGWLAVTPESLVILCALMCSGAMAFPISSFPNVNSLLAEDEKGQPYLRAKDFLFCGTAITLFFTVCLITWMVPLTNAILH